MSAIWWARRGERSVVSFGGPGVMVAGALLSGVVLLALAVLVARRTGGAATALLGAGLVWSVVVIALVTLVPAQGAPGVVFAEGRLETCSWDVGGPAPDGFWIFDGGQRLLNTLLFVPAGLLGVLLAARARSWTARLAGSAAVLGGLVALSIGIEWTQLELARIDRACDVTDVIDNATGALVGVLLGAVAAGLLGLDAARRRDGGHRVR